MNKPNSLGQKIHTLKGMIHDSNDFFAALEEYPSTHPERLLLGVPNVLVIGKEIHAIIVYQDNVAEPKTN